MNETVAHEFSIEALRTGDRAEFARLVDAYSTPIYRLGLKILGNSQDAEDVLQNTFLSALTHLKDFEGRSRISTWLYRIASNEALMSLMFPAHPYGTPVVGWPADIARLSHDDAMAYFRTYYSPSNCVMVLVGDVRTADVERLAKKYLGPWQRQEMPPRVATAEPEPRGERRRVVEFDAEPTLRMGLIMVG